MIFQFHVEYGWSAPLIKDQFEKFDGLETPPDKEVERWQKIADALLMVSLHSIIPRSQVQAGRNKLAGRIEKWLVDNEYIVKAEEPAQ
ncbi:MAG: hypothetical protein AAFR02_12200 [Pseudomonadota bacterium]